MAWSAKWRLKVQPGASGWKFASRLCTQSWSPVNLFMLSKKGRQIDASGDWAPWHAIPAVITISIPHVCVCWGGCTLCYRGPDSSDTDLFKSQSTTIEVQFPVVVKLHISNHVISVCIFFWLCLDMYACLYVCVFIDVWTYAVCLLLQLFITFSYFCFDIVKHRHWKICIKLAENES